ncbi:hypothetical protein MRX96_035294 [Rhipicephalus microplus]
MVRLTRSSFLACFNTFLYCKRVFHPDERLYQVGVLQPLKYLILDHRRSCCAKTSGVSQTNQLLCELDSSLVRFLHPASELGMDADSVFRQREACVENG